MKASGRKKKSKKKLVIGVGVLAVAAVAGANIYGSRNAAENAVPQVKVVKAVRDNVQQTVETSGIVVSEEQKTYFSPVNAKVDVADVKEGETVKAGTKLVEFDQKDLEREEKKAELNVKSGKLDMQNTLNKSAEAVQKQQNAQGNAAYSETAGSCAGGLHSKYKSKDFSGKYECTGWQQRRKQAQKTGGCDRGSGGPGRGCSEGICGSAEEISE